MDFTLPEDLRDYLAELDEFIEREIKPLERQDDNIGSSTTAGKTPGPTGTAAACPAASGRRCSARHAKGPTRPATTGTPSPNSTAAGTAPTWAWR